jgi:hypothetical protein
MNSTNTMRSPHPSQADAANTSAATNALGWSSVLLRAGLIATAIVLATLSVAQITRLIAAHGMEPTALAGLVSDAGGVTVMTVEANNDELVFVIDSRNEDLMVYKAESNQSLVLLNKYPMGELFSAAKARSGGQ